MSHENHTVKPPCCLDCKHFIFGPRATGRCRRYPPQINHEGNSRFPTVRIDWWCGEFGSDLTGANRQALFPEKQLDA